MLQMTQGIAFPILSLVPRNQLNTVYVDGELSQYPKSQSLPSIWSHLWHLRLRWACEILGRKSGTSITENVS